MAKMRWGRPKFHLKFLAVLVTSIPQLYSGSSPTNRTSPDLYQQYPPAKTFADVDRETFDLSVKNPNKAEESALREPQEILDEIAALDAESAEILAGIGGML